MKIRANTIFHYTLHTLKIKTIYICIADRRIIVEILRIILLQELINQGLFQEISKRHYTKMDSRG